MKKLPVVSTPSLIESQSLTAQLTVHLDAIQYHQGQVAILEARLARILPADVPLLKFAGLAARH